MQLLSAFREQLPFAYVSCYTHASPYTWKRPDKIIHFNEAL